MKHQGLAAEDSTVIDRALEAAMPEVFGKDLADKPSDSQIARLHYKLAGLQRMLVAVGEADGLTPLLAALADGMRQHDIAAHGTHSKGDEAVSVLREFVDATRRAVKPGRDGSELVSLYGHGAKLDQCITALRVHSAARFMLSGEAKRMGLEDESALPVTLRNAIHGEATSLVKREYELATKKLQILRVMGRGNGFVPDLATLRITPELVRGMGNDKEVGNRVINVLLGASLVSERRLADSPEGKRMLGLVEDRLQDMKSKLEAMPEGAAVPRKTRTRGHLAYLERRAAALLPQRADTGLSEEECAALGLKDVTTEEAENLLLSMAQKGLASVNEVNGALSSAGKVLRKMKRHQPRIARADAAYQKTVDHDHGNGLAAALLHQLTGNSALQEQSGPISPDQVRAGLSRPDSPLALLMSSARDANTPLRQSLHALATRYESFLNIVRQAEAQQRRDSKGKNTTPQEHQQLLDTIELGRQGMADMIKQRQNLLGQEHLASLEDAMRAAVLTTPADALVTRGPGDAFIKIRHAANKIGLAVQSPGKRLDLHAQAVQNKLKEWGLEADVVGPEAHHLVENLGDTLPLDQWSADFRPQGEVLAHWDEQQAALAERMMPGGENAELASAALKRLIDGIPTLDRGTALNWTLQSRVKVTPTVLPITPIQVAGLNVQFSGQLERQSGIHVQRDEKGYQLILNAGHEATGKAGVALGRDIANLVAAEVSASIKATGHRLTGVALRFPDTQEGCQDLEATLKKLLDQGGMKTSDLENVIDVIPVVERKAAGRTSANASLGLNVPPLKCDSHLSFTLIPGGEAVAAAAMKSYDKLNANHNQELHQHEHVFIAKVSVSAHAGLSTGTLMDSVAPVSVEHTHKFVDIRCTVTTRDVREGGLLAGNIERTLRFKCGKSHLNTALGQAGGKPLRTLLTNLRASDRPDDKKMAENVAALLAAVQADDEVAVVWRLKPEIQNNANELLQRARTVANHQLGPLEPKDAAVQAARLKTQAKDLLNEAENYELHGLKRMSHERTIASIGRLRDLSKLNVGAVAWDKRMDSAHTRPLTSVVFDKTQVRAAHAQGAS